MNGAVSARGASPQLSPQNWGNQYSMKMHHGEGGLPSPWCEHCPRSYGSLTLSRGRNTGALKVVIITGSPRQHGVAPPPRTEIAPKKDLPFLFEIAAVAICPEMKKTRFVEGMHRRAQKCAPTPQFSTDYLRGVKAHVHVRQKKERLVVRAGRAESIGGAQRVKRRTNDV